MPNPGLPTHLSNSGDHSRGYLPHFVRPGAEYFVTFRLADSLPQEVLVELERELAAAQNRTEDARGLRAPALPVQPGISAETRPSERRKRIERYLDSGAGRAP